MKIKRESTDDHRQFTWPPYRPSELVRLLSWSLLFALTAITDPTAAQQVEPQPPTAASASDAVAAAENGDTLVATSTESPAAENAAGKQAALPEPARIDELSFNQYLVIPRVGRYGRGPLHVDPIAAAFASGSWRFPEDGQEITAAEGATRTWTGNNCDPDGWLRKGGLGGGYAAAKFDLDVDQTFLLEATGHVMAYVNGAPRAGDPYLTGRTVTPVRLRRGENQVIFQLAGSGLRARLSAPVKEAAFDLRDATWPDIVVGAPTPMVGAVLIVNSSAETLRRAEITTVRPGGRKVTKEVPQILPFSARKVVVPIDGALTQDEAQAQAVRVQMDLTLPTEDPAAPRKVVDSAAFDLAVVQREQLHLRTFVSDVDGSVQQYAFLPGIEPAPSLDDDQPSLGLLLALHETGKTPQQLLENVSALPGLHIAAPMGRRPIGFDWEDWSRADVIEVLRDIERRDGFDSQRTAVVGAGAGGHGALRIASTLPDRFASLTTFGAWLSYHTYGRSVHNWTDPNRVEAIFSRCGNVTKTAPLLENLSSTTAFIYHQIGDPDVPVRQARTIRRQLANFHPDFSYRESTRELGASPLRALTLGSVPADHLFTRLSPAAAEVDQIEFVSLNLAESSGRHWVRILRQQRQFERSSISIACNTQDRRFQGVSENVEAIEIDVSHLSPLGNISVQLDGQLLDEVSWPEEQLRLILARNKGRWSLSHDNRRLKHPQRAGGFREAWNNRVALVYGSNGNADENAWALSKAKYDAETFLVRGAGSLDVIADADFRPTDFPDRNIVLYGNADTNVAWRRLLSTSPVQVRRGRVDVGSRPELGDDLAVLMARPRRDSETASVAVIGGTGIVGMRATDRLPYFVSGVVLPDLLIVGADALTLGSREIRAAGFFGNNWSITDGEIAWRDASL